jgi:hypothetical protein
LPQHDRSLNFFPGCGQDGDEFYKEKALAAQGCNAHTMIVEPKTGVRFPVQLSCTDFDNQPGESNPSCQVGPSEYFFDLSLEVHTHM